MKISVIVPTYKPGSYLCDCMQSLADQTLDKSEFEVLIVQNGCGEPYTSYIQNLIDVSLNGLNVRVIRLEKGGVSNARNTAMDQAQGEYIAFIDDDDYVSATYLEALLHSAAPDVVALSNTFSFIDEEEHIYTPFRITRNYDALVGKGRISINKAKKFFSGPCMKLVHRDIIGDRRFDLRFKNGEDSIFMFLLSDRISATVCTTPDAIYYRRFRAGSAVTTSRSFGQRTKNALKMIREYFKIYFGSFPKYDTLFFITRIMGAIKGLIIH